MARGLRFRRKSARRPLDEMVAASRADNEVQAYVEARLLGIRLLSLRARVVTGKPAPPASVAPTLTHIRPVDAVDRTTVRASNELGRAVDLLGESTRTLQQLSSRSG